MTTVQDVIKQLCILGISDIKVSWNKEKGMLCYDLNTRAKSHLYLFEDFSVERRYDYHGWIDNNQALDFIIQELYYEFESCVDGRDFFSVEWKELGVKLGLIRKQTITLDKYY